MIFSTKFVSATTEKSTTKKNVAAPYLRRTLIFDVVPERAEITVCGLGFYELFINGKKITKGHLSPYIVNPDQVLPYDTYDITDMLIYGENVFAFMLGNGMQNSFDGYIWDFQKARFMSAPKLAFALETVTNGEISVIEADENLLCHPSPIYFDGYRMGEKYDARREIPNWNLIGCDLSDWTPAIPVQTDRGECMLACNRPIVPTYELKPVSITREDDGGYVYDFGYNCVGLSKLTINGYFGQHIVIDHGELIRDGKFTTKNLVFGYPKPNQLGEPKYVQRTEYICHGGNIETHTPSFTYYGFRYANVWGITEEQATPDLLTYIVMNTDLGDRGGFKCSNDTLNAVQEMSRRATLGNFQHFPNDCPHREKNGWTGDAALSAEQTIMNFEPEDNYLMWEKCLVRAMTNRGELPGIVPTGDWGFNHNGPAWDCALVWLPYYAAVLRDDLRLAKEATHAMLRYLEYLRSRRDENGLLPIGLGDACSAADRTRSTPVIFTSSVIAYDVALKAAYLYDRLDRDLEADYCRGFAKEIRKKIRTHLLDKDTMKFSTGTQTTQSFALYYGLYDNEEEKQKTLDRLIEAIHAKDDHISVGILGGKTIFSVLCDNGYEDLALKLITRPDGPSYGSLVAAGCTTLMEQIFVHYGSGNHHFWGDVSALMIQYFAGIRVNIDMQGANHINIAPLFPAELDFAEAYHNSVCGMVKVRWEKGSDSVKLSLSYPDGATGYVIAPDGYTVNGEEKVTALTGEFTFIKK